MKLSGHASQDAVYGTAIAFAILAGLSVIARIITRIFIVKRAGVDDAFAVVGFVCLLLPLSLIWGPELTAWAFRYSPSS